MFMYVSFLCMWQFAFVCSVRATFKFVFYVMFGLVFVVYVLLLRLGACVCLSRCSWFVV